MLFSIAVALLLLQLPLSTMQAPVKQRAVTPAEKKGNPAEKRVYKSRTTRLPFDLDLEKTPLRMLLAMRPQNHAAPEGDLYKFYFEHHPDVQKIDLHHHETEITAQKLVDLTSDGTHNRSSKIRAAASINNLIEDTPFSDTKHQEKLKKDYKGARHMAARRLGNQNYEGKFTQEERAKQRRQNYHIRKMMNGGIVRHHEGKRGQVDEAGMDKPLSFHLDNGGGGVSAREAEERVRRLSHLYHSERTLTRKLDKYLKDNNTSPEEYSAVMGLRQRHIMEKRLNRGDKSASVMPGVSVEYGADSFSQSGQPLLPSSMSLQASSPTLHQLPTLSSPLRHGTPPTPQHRLPPQHHQEHPPDPLDHTKWAWIDDMLID